MSKKKLLNQPGVIFFWATCLGLFYLCQTGSCLLIKKCHKEDKMKIRDFLVFTLLVTSLFRCDYEKGSGSDIPNGDEIKASLKVIQIPDIEIYVKTPQDGGDDGNPGTPDLPKATIQAAVDLIPADEFGRVHVAGGIYAPCTVTDYSRIDLLGGYNPGDWKDRDISPNAGYIYQTKIESPADSGPAVAVSMVKYLIFEGFRAKSYKPDTPAMDVKKSRIIIQNNYVTRGGEQGTALNVELCVGIIGNNVIYGSINNAAGTTYALRIYKSNLEVTDNTIHGGVQDNTAGIVIDNSTGKVKDNFIIGGEGKYTGAIQITGVYSILNNPLEITGNNIYGGYGTEEALCIKSQNGNIIVENNPDIDAQGGNLSFNSKKTRAIFSSQGAAQIKNNQIVGGWYSENTCGIEIEDSTGYNVEIENNSISGGAQTGLGRGISLKNTYAVISHNKIFGASPEPSVGIGIDLNKSPALVINNSINGGFTAYSRTMAIVNINSDSRIISNSINTGRAIRGVFGIYNIMDSHPEITNNIIFFKGTSLPQVSYGIINTSGSYPVVSYNDIWVANDTGTDYTGENYNISVDPKMAFSNEEDYSLTANSPVSVTQGAFNYSGITAVDILYNPRTDPWSMGAYEYDAP